MSVLAAYVFEYRLFILAGLIFAWSVASWKKCSFTKRPFFRYFPFIFAIAMLASFFYSPIVITSPLSHTTVLPGKKVEVRVELTPRFLSSLYPWVSLTLYRCYKCTDAPPGITMEGPLTGPPYIFILNFPRDEPSGEIFIDAYASMKMGGHAAVRSRGIGLIVK